ncbi:uncharacterized protein N7477_008833 [Penicillium maclennaniae]|uniref:uncharacterized protein n=1 Tax=Penicillium maclennaniae TaxID=1343394 RepID=UPI00253FBBC2|nr:uncharacterized protein N7477_008833 [Penicillium maclennaniae]KAJ5666385.1 hypothetical protein N7477_008833 [Penicillium maclennaniae]
MALVAYSDSEGSDAEPENTAAPSTTKKPESGSGFRIDRSNPRKIQVALPEIKPEHTLGQDEDGPARKKPRVGGGGAFSGFNSFLPAPRKAEQKAPVATTRKVFSLKTGATPGFSREADAEMRNDFAFNADAVGDDATIPAAGSLGSQITTTDAPIKTEIGEVKLQGNPMMFRPLSVARNQKKKKTTKITPQPRPSTPALTGQPADTVAPQPTTTAPAAPAPPKPKVSLFSLSSEDTSRADEIPNSSGTYEPLIYSNEAESASAGPVPAPEFDSAIANDSAAATVPSQASTLDNIANDLKLSKAERRQLFGRNVPSAEARILEFNTDKEYATNQVLAKTELAATQHNPVRAIAPGKHSLQQLVNAASSQKEALEESFATGRRNKKEAGSKYGW